MLACASMLTCRSLRACEARLLPPRVDIADERSHLRPKALLIDKCTRKEAESKYNGTANASPLAPPTLPPARSQPAH